MNCLESIIGQFPEIKTIAINSDNQQLKNTKILNRVHIVANNHDSLQYINALEQQKEHILELVENSTLVIFVSGLGGNCGSYVTPHLCRLLHESGRQTRSLIIMPFDFEGTKRMQKAIESEAMIRQWSDHIITYKNQSLLHNCNDNTCMTDALRVVDQELIKIIQESIDHKDEPDLLPPFGQFMISSVIQEIYEELNSGQPAMGISTGFKDLDLFTSGLHRGELIVIGSRRPSMGTSAFVMNLLNNISICGEEKLKAAVLTSDLSARQWTKRLLSIASDVGHQELRTFALDTEAWRKVAKSFNQIADAQVQINDMSTASLSQIYGMLVMRLNAACMVLTSSSSTSYVY